MSGISAVSGITLTGAADLTNVTGVLPSANGGAITSNPLSVYAAGTAYSLTNSAAAVTFGTTSPALTITAAGAYLIIARFKLLYNGATFAANQTITSKLRRTNNTAADLANASATVTSSIITTITGLCSDQTIAAIYATTNTNDSISLFSSIGTVPAAGSLDVSEASIVAIRLQV